MPFKTPKRYMYFELQMKRKHTRICIGTTPNFEHLWELGTLQWFMTRQKLSVQKILVGSFDQATAEKFPGQ